MLNKLFFAWTWHGGNPVLSLLSMGKLYQISGITIISVSYASLCTCLLFRSFICVRMSFNPDIPYPFFKRRKKKQKKRKKKAFQQAGEAWCQGFCDIF